MSTWYFPAALAIAAVLAVAAGLWVSLRWSVLTCGKARAVDPTRKTPEARASRADFRKWLALFAGGTAISLAVPFLILSQSGD
jgi:hypothetical protein